MYDLWYDLDLVKGNFLDDVIFVRIFVNDSSQSMSIDGIPSAFKNKIDCKFIKKNKAMVVARKNGLEKGLNNWEARCHWKKDGGEWIRKDSISIMVSNGYYFWLISNDLESTSNPCKNGYGEGVRINAESGEFIDKRRYSYSYVN